MSAGVVRRTPQTPGRILALLYFANSLGAAAGALLSGFVLIAAFGLLPRGRSSPFALAPLLESEVRSNSDFFPLLDQGAERAQYRGESAEGFLWLHRDRFSFTLLAGGRRVESIPSFQVPAPEIPRLRNLAMSAALRTALPRGVDPKQLDDRLPAARARRLSFQRKLDSEEPATDWRAWVREALNAEDDWHLGSLGVVDEDFYGRLDAYMTGTAAPPEARQTVELLHDLATWNLTEAAQASEPLVLLAAKEQDWLPPEMLLDSVVTARLLIGDVAGARRVFDALLPRVERDPRDLRTRLARAYFDGTPSRSPCSAPTNCREGRDFRLVFVRSRLSFPVGAKPC